VVWTAAQLESAAAAKGGRSQDSGQAHDPGAKRATPAEQRLPFGHRAPLSPSQFASPTDPWLGHHGRKGAWDEQMDVAKQLNATLHM
jgi:hypothetical protein